MRRKEFVTVNKYLVNLEAVTKHLFLKEIMKTNYHIFKGLLTAPCCPYPVAHPPDLPVVMQQVTTVLSFRNFILLFFI